MCLFTLQPFTNRIGKNCYSKILYNYTANYGKNLISQSAETHSMQAPNASIKFNKGFLLEKEAPKHSVLCMEKNKNQQLNWGPASKVLSEP